MKYEGVKYFYLASVIMKKNHEVHINKWAIMYGDYIYFFHGKKNERVCISYHMDELEQVIGNDFYDSSNDELNEIFETDEFKKHNDKEVIKLL